MCHSGPDSSSPFGGFPSLVDASTWAAQRKPGMSAADYLRESLRKPTAFVSPAFVDSGGPTSGMPDLGLSDAEIEAVVRYLLAAD
jgi:mono/diheme cytochrome c family protein